MFRNKLLIQQAKLFNTELDNIQIQYIINNNIMVYDGLLNISNKSLENISEIELDWVYDENNFRIPYLNGIKVQQIKLNDVSNIFDYISSSSLINKDNIIYGEKFVSMSDVFIGSINSINANPNNKYIQQNIFNIENNLYDIVNNYNKIFVKTDDLMNFYNKINNQKIDITNKIIISHNSDHEINIQYNSYLNNVKKQYSQNCLITHKNLEAIPIGIENRQWFDHEILHKIINRDDIKKEKNIYFMFSLHTNFSRQECYDKLKNKLQWNVKLSKEDYFIELKKHKYAICPRGNGLDTHRIWECLYLDVIPIMLKKDYVGIDNLPIVYLNDWDELDVNNINNTFKNIKYSKITFDYYKNKI
jgi:hypothetical protein